MKITETAKTYIEMVMKENNVDTLRLFVEGEGCCGPSWSLALEPAQDTDVVENINGINVAMEPSLVETLKTIQLDMQEEGGEQGLVINGGCC